MSAVANELKPCPFCGGPAERIEITEDDGFKNRGGSVIECQQCHASSHVEFGRKENLVSAWNTRPAPADPVDGLELYRPEPMSLGGMVRDPDGGYVTRSQAVELLAAERAAQQRLLDIIEEANDDKEALEAKLAAAEKALEAARPYVEDYDTRRHNTGVDETLSQIDAVLGGKPD